MDSRVAHAHAPNSALQATQAPIAKSDRRHGASDFGDEPTVSSRGFLLRHNKTCNKISHCVANEQTRIHAHAAADLEVSFSGGVAILLVGVFSAFQLLYGSLFLLHKKFRVGFRARPYLGGVSRPRCPMLEPPLTCTGEIG